jgi:hypothetical protein
MKSLQEVIESLLDYNGSTNPFDADFPVEFKPVKKWIFPNSQFGEVWSSAGKIGFYELRGQNKFVTIYTDSKLRRKWIDNRATQNYGAPIPKELVRDWVQKKFGLQKDNTVFWWSADEYIDNIDGGSVPSLGNNEDGWAHFIKDFQKFFKQKTSSSIEDQINFSKGIYN